MTKRAKSSVPSSIAADPSQWSEQSKQSVAFHFKSDYVDEPYECCRCGTACVFTAQDQKYTFEVKKASIDQRRKWCAGCWSEAHQLRAALSERERRWADEKSILKVDRDFLNNWLELMTRWKQFEPYKQDVARINMLHGLLGIQIV